MCLFLRKEKGFTSNALKMPQNVAVSPWVKGAGFEGWLLGFFLEQNALVSAPLDKRKLLLLLLSLALFMK